MSEPARSVLSDGTIRRLVEEGRIKIEPWDPAMVQPASVDLRLARNLPIGERVKIDFISEVFNLFNRVNVSTVNNLFTFVRFDDGKFKSQPTAVFDPRQFQFAIKVSF